MASRGGNLGDAIVGVVGVFELLTLGVQLVV